MDIRIPIKCPYCSTEQTHAIQASWGREVVNCDVEIGGCDGYYAVKWEVNVLSSSHAIDWDKI